MIIKNEFEQPDGPTSTDNLALEVFEDELEARLLEYTVRTRWISTILQAAKELKKDKKVKQNKSEECISHENSLRYTKYTGVAYIYISQSVAYHRRMLYVMSF